jgi:choline dehydrogenase-like flavoprotein
VPDLSADVLVIGAGATGGWAAMDLAERGLAVLVLDAGPWQEPTSPFLTTARGATRSMNRQKPAWAARKPVQSQCYACREDTHHLFVDDVENPYVAPPDKPFTWIRSRQVGGRTLAWFGHCYRFGPSDFKSRSLEGVAEDWPLEYEELAPFYGKVERYLRLQGSVERLEQVPDGEFAGEPKLWEGEALFRDRVNAHYADRRVISPRVAARTRDGGPVGSGWPHTSAPGSTLADAVATGRCEIRANAVVRRVLLEPGGRRAIGAEFVDRQTGEVHRALAKTVLLCASTIESTRLLLASHTSDHPDGLGNTSGVLGRFLMVHAHGISVRGSVPELSGYAEETPMTSGVYVPRFQHRSEGARPFTRGYGVQTAVFPYISRESVMSMRGDPEANLRSLLAYKPRARFWSLAFGEMLPRADNRVTLEASSVDAHGVPIPRIECTWGENEKRMAPHMLEELKGMARAAGFQVEGETTALEVAGLCIHEVGSARMGADRASSVLDPHNRVWGVDNLFVTDGACFPSNPCQNPTLTMMALTARACEHIAASR